jgi:hypothetical protein
MAALDQSWQKRIPGRKPVAERKPSRFTGLALDSTLWRSSAAVGRYPGPPSEDLATPMAAEGDGGGRRDQELARDAALRSGDAR